VDAFGPGKTDEELWLRALEGDGSAFAVVFDRHANAVFTHCLRRGASWADAQDQTSMVFLETWRKAGTLRFVEGSARPWLLLVATNVARNDARSRRRYAQAVQRLPPAESEPDIADEAIRSADSQESTARVAAAVASLRRPEQEVIALCHLENLSYVDAAEVLGIPVGTVRSRLSRARKRLLEILGPGYVEGSAPGDPELDIYAANGGRQP
jgi:RNA polymerase sigma factor (sigma-70 family)